MWCLGDGRGLPGSIHRSHPLQRAPACAHPPTLPHPVLPPTLLLDTSQCDYDSGWIGSQEIK